MEVKTKIDSALTVLPRHYDGEGMGKVAGFRRSSAWEVLMHLIWEAGERRELGIIPRCWV